jgi:hydroxyacylglutathione hydrolase
MIQIKKFVFNVFSENTFILWDDESKECAVVDPGCSAKSEEQILENFIRENNLIVKYLINTHCHIDHILGCRYIKDKFNIDYYAPENDLPLLDNAKIQAKMFGIQFSNAVIPDKFITEETKLNIGDSPLDFLFTPGHTPGEYCIFMPKEKYCITGDVLFYDSIGRTDLWGGDHGTLINSIQKKLLQLPDETKIFPGHGDNSTIGREKNQNPFLIELN